METRRRTSGMVLEHLRSFGRQTALISQRGPVLTYAELADRAEEFAKSLGNGRKLVMLAGQNEISAIVAYLGALAGGHAVLLVPDTAANPTSDLTRIYDPDVIVAAAGDSCELDVRREKSVHELHPDLALCLSTSGSTGSPKLVRLSYDNVLSNARAIAEYLEITSDHRAITTLPMYYCYGLSVIHSHLVQGAGLLLTNDSVVDQSFWDFFTANEGSSFAGVPYTFDLLETAGFGQMHLPHLRYITQAGGRLAPEKVRGYAETGAAAGWKFFVMYGATEATARMAYLPPELAAEHPECIGVPIPGGSFRIEQSEGLDDGTGELVYSGPNVMLGYAQESAELALGRTITELRTGDIARITDAGLYQVVGRSARFIKLFGLRIDLQRIETVLAAEGITACCAGTDEKLVVAVEGKGETVAIHELVADTAHLPKHTIDVVLVDKMPRLGSGKPDYPAIRALAATPSAATGGSVRGLFTSLLRVPAVDVHSDSTFVSLGGDSMSFVTMSARLEKLLGHLPEEWHKKSIAELEASRRESPGIFRTIETGIVLRAIAIVFVIGSHTGIWAIWGGAHFLLAASGYYFARFILTEKPANERFKHSATTILRIAIPCWIWIIIAELIFGTYAPTNALFLSRILGPMDVLTVRLWYIEVLINLLVLVTLLIAIPAVSRLEMRWPFYFALGVLAFALFVRLGSEPYLWGPFALLMPFPNTLFSLLAGFFFAFGWAAAKSTKVWHRALITVLVFASLWGYFDPRYIAMPRTYVCAAFIVLLIWVPRVRIPGFLVPVAIVLANASLYIYLTHWQVLEVMPHGTFTTAAVALTFGIAVYYLWDKASAWGEAGLKRAWAKRRQAHYSGEHVPQHHAAAGSRTPGH